MSHLIIKFELSDNPYTTSQEKGVTVRNGYVRFYEKDEVAKMRQEYTQRIRRFIRVNNIDVPDFKDTLKLKVIFCFRIQERRKWGCLKATKPDCDNAVKLLQDVLAEELGFQDQQIAELQVAKFWAEKPTVCIEIEEVACDLYRLKR